MVKHLLALTLALCITNAELLQALEWLQKCAREPQEYRRNETNRLLVNEVIRRYRQHGICK